MGGFDQRKQEERKKYEFDTWLLQLPPINLYNVDLVYLAFGYDVRYDLMDVESHSTTTRKRKPHRDKREDE